MKRGLPCLLLVCATCRIPSTAGLPCASDQHCDQGQYCELSGPEGICQPGDPEETTGTSGDDGSDSSGTGDDGGTTGPEETGTSEETGMGCGVQIDFCDSIDLLFVVDNSGSMTDDLLKLAAVLNPEALVPGLLEKPCSGHAGVTTTDPNWRAQPVECQERGALNRSNALAEDCWGDGPPYATQDDNLNALTCPLIVGTNNADDEKQVDTILGALAPEINEPTGCNEDFLQDDSALLIVLVTDEDDDDDSGTPGEEPHRTGSAGNPVDWFDWLLEIRPAEKLGIVAIMPTSDTTCEWVPDANDGQGGEFAVSLSVLVNQLEAAAPGHTLTANICGPADDIAGELQGLEALIETLCDDAEG